jgi:post-segregation antitoxin (ccd killing protein)
MRAAKYNVKAVKRTVSLTLNSDLYAQAKALDINASQVAEEALAYEVNRRIAEKLKAEIREDIEALDAYEAKHGSFVDIAREHYQSAARDREAK